MNPTGKSTVFGIIGNPISHTVSPAMHNAAFAKLSLDCIYIPFRVTVANLEYAVTGAKALGIRGFNVTVPHKVEVIPFLDSLDISASDAGAVNTVLNSQGRLTGFNTDGAGFIFALKKAEIEVKGRNVVVIGAGGAARAISFSLVREGARVTLINRTKDKSYHLSRNLEKVTGHRVPVLLFNSTNLKKALSKASVVVNATSLGMYPDSDISPVPLSLLRDDLAVFDIIYNPLPTHLVLEAKAVGARVTTGLDMLVGQGALSFEIWTGKKAPLKTMENAALKALERHER